MHNLNKNVMYLGAGVLVLVAILAAIISSDSSQLQLENVESSPLVVSNSPRPEGSAAASPVASPVVSGEPITVRGTMVCLPHKNTDGPQTLECAYGLKTEAGNYGLRDSDPTYKNIMGLPMGEEVEITGVFEAKTDAKYDSLGVIEIRGVVKKK